MKFKSGSVIVVVASALTLLWCGVFESPERKVVRELQRSIVSIELLGERNGTGVIIDGNYVVTNSHVVWPFEQVTVITAEGRRHTEVPVIAFDYMADLAVVGPLEGNHHSSIWIDGESQPIGTEVFTVGFVQDSTELTATRGKLLRSYEWEPVGMTYLETDAVVHYGQSGGVLVTKNEECW